MIWWVALGSALGGMTRYALGGWIQTRAGSVFPLATLVVNVTGSFLIGLIQPFALASSVMSPEVRVFLTIGFCGGYTTFSTFSFETVRLLQGGDWRRAGFYMVSSLLLCVGAAILGVLCARELLALRHR